MADSEKLTALKKAYANIILNTAKEAAARIMVSEKKALRFQQELLAVKEEALRMLLRLKQMLDSKVNEAEMTSLNQQKRIDELEAQLGEAEDIVRDLREELEEVQDELGKVKHNQMQALAEKDTYTTNVTQMMATEKNRLTSVPVPVPMPVVSEPNPLPEEVTSFVVRDSTLNGTSECSKCNNENGSQKDSCHFCSSDFASILRRKELELYRNGCTHRIRAFEGNMLDGNLSLSGQVDDTKNEKFSRQDEEGDEMGIKSDPKARKICGLEKSLDEIKVMQADTGSVQVQAISIGRKRKRHPRHKKRKGLSCSDLSHQVVEMCQAIDDTLQNQAQEDQESPLRPKSLTDMEKMNALSNFVEDTRSYAECPLGPESPTKAAENEMIKRPGRMEVSKSDAEFIRSCTFQKTTDGDELCADKLELMREESTCAESSGFPACKTDLQAVDVSLVSSEVKASELTQGVATQPAANGLLKYTFQRKRKKESLSSPDGKSSFDDGSLRRKTDENQNGSLELQKPKLIPEPSRHSRRLAQVARQLVSLSQKKW